MAIYRTNTEELTSIANAIRAKTGNNSSLIYPTGFVSAIQNIPYNWMGEDVTFIDTLYEHTYKLSDTSFNANNVTTSNSNIVSSSNLDAINLSAEYDYIFKVLGAIDYQYTTALTNISHLIEGYFCGILIIGRKPMRVSDFNDNTISYVSYGSSAYGYNNFYQASNGTSAWTANGYGITFSINGPSFLNQYADIFTMTPKTATIRINYNNTYIPQDAINALDTENTTIYMKHELYRCKQNNTWQGINNETVKLYQAKHNIT